MSLFWGTPHFADPTVKFAFSADEALVIVRRDPKNPPAPGSRISLGDNCR